MNSMWRDDCYRGKRLLVTGASGFLATNLVAALKNVDCHIRRLSRPGSLLTGMQGAAGIEDMIGDIADSKTWERALEGIDIIFHFAAQTSVYAANEDPRADLMANVVPMIEMLDVCRKRNLRPTVLFAGTVTEAGIPSRLPVDESHPDNPVTIYDLHKLMAENYLKYFVGQGTLQGAVLRLANVYGPGPESGSAGRGVLNTMVRKALRGETLTIYGQGDYLRDYVYVGDVVGAFLAAGAAIDSLSGRHFIIGSGRGVTIAEAVRKVAELVGKVSGRPVAVVHIDPPRELSLIEKRDFVADAGRFSKAADWAADTSLADGIALTIDSFLKEMKVAS